VGYADQQLQHPCVRHLPNPSVHHLRNNWWLNSRCTLGEGGECHQAGTGSTLPDTAFNRIKASANIHDAWEILRHVYEEQFKALVTNLIQRFQNKHCEEDKSIRLHFEYLADLHKQLVAMSKSVTDKDYTDTLPTSYNGAVSSISASVHLGSKALMAEISEQLILDESEWQQVKDRYTESRDKAQATDSGK
jgi:gag-polypeptide of LTR copia-type